MKFCAQCGAEIAPGTRFCMKCGTPVAADSSTSNEAGAPVSTGATVADEPTVWASPAPGQQASSPWSATPAPAAPWAAGGSTQPAGNRQRAPRKPLPKGPIIALAALLAVGTGAGIAYSMRPAPSESLDAALLGQQGQAPSKAPQQKWSLKNDDIVRAAGLDTSSYASSSTSVLSYGTNGLILMTVPNEGVVAVKETKGEVAWQVKGSFTACEPLVNKAGWACIYAPPRDSSEDTSTPEQQLVTLDSNGRINKLRTIKEGEGLYREATGTLWVVSGLPDSEDGAGSDSNDTASISVTRLGDDGKPAWSYEHNAIIPGTASVTSGQAAAPLFTMDGITYVRGVQDSNGKGIALDSSGKQTDKADSAVLGNDKGRPITMKDGHYRDGGETMKKDVSALASPTMADTGLLPLYDTTNGEVRKLNDEGTDTSWKVNSNGATPLAYCGKTTVLTTSDNKAWFLNKDGKDAGSRTLDGQPQFCWGGHQLISLDSQNGAVVSNNLTDGGEAWKLELPKDDSGNVSNPTALVYSPTTDGFVTSGGNALTYYGP